GPSGHGRCQGRDAADRDTAGARYETRPIRTLRGQVDPELAVDDLDRIDADRLGRRPLEDGARLEVELREVATAGDPRPLENAVAERAFLVRAVVVERVPLAT